MPTKEEFFEQMSEIYELFLRRWKTIISISISVWLGLPYIKIIFWQIFYFFNSSEWVLNRLTQATFSVDTLLPLWIGFMIDPRSGILSFILILILVAIILYIIKNL